MSNNNNNNNNNNTISTENTGLWSAQNYPNHPGVRSTGGSL